MTTPLLIQRERELLRRLTELAAQRAEVEGTTESAYKSRNQAVEKEFEQARELANARFESEIKAIEQEYQETRERISAGFELEHTYTSRDVKDLREKIASRFHTEKETAEKEVREGRWMIATLHETAKKEAQEKFTQVKRRLGESNEQAKELAEQAAKLLEEWQQPAPPASDATAAAGNGTAEQSAGEFDPDELLSKLGECLNEAQTHVEKLKELVVPSIVQGWRLVWAAVLLWLVVLYPSQRLGLIQGMLGATVGVGLVFGGTRFGLGMIAKAQITRHYVPLVDALADAARFAKRCEEQATVRYQRQLARAKERQDTERRQADETFRRQRAQIQERRDTSLREVDAKYPPILAGLKRYCDDGLREADDKYPRLLAELRTRHETESRQAQQAHDRRLDDSRAGLEAEWASLSGRWHDGVAGVHGAVAEINSELNRLFPPWNGSTWNGWVPPASVPPVMRYGAFRVGLAQIPNGLPQDERLHTPEPHEFSLPALLPFPDGCSMLVKVRDQGRGPAEVALQAVMLRMLTSVPPGKIRFTIIDPVGLGQNFAAFMHLADHDELLVSSRIWTEPQHIEQRLADLTGHMENVIQKYLRNQFETIQDYNAHAEEVAEPFRVLVVVNFPVNFSEAAARRLVSIASSGARCGVYTLITVDTKQPLPHGFNLTDLDQYASNLLWQGERFIWRDADFQQFPFEPELPAPEEAITPLLQVVGQRAKEASRVQVPFEFVVPPAEQWWTNDSCLGVTVPLGRVGATKRQMLKLGEGTSQHVLIAGKTGSGKSTLLHALITNLSLMYSPEEIQLYLVDFKKGVEFKTYATYELPHARVVAIESEREFGLSVMQRLDAELKLRGDMFRELGVQDLAGYRQSDGKSPLPRVLLIVDEFQEFFIEDDKIAQEAALLLDRLVRQGRAFGIHVLLGSQTLGGAYTLARSTIGQMAVRIALQCSESDAHLILSDDNTAARLLTRPGEAIYNDANGLVEGNNPFQVVWLHDERREQYLLRIQELARQRRYVRLQPQIVFEGNQPADLSKNHVLSELLLAATWPGGTRAAATSDEQFVAGSERRLGMAARPIVRWGTAWLGDAIAIKDPTAAVFRPQSANNLLMIGQNDEAAMGIIVSAVIGLAAQHPPAGASPRDVCPAPTAARDDSPLTPGAPGLRSTHHSPTPAMPPARFYLLDGSRVDAPYAGYLPRLSDLLPHPMKVVGWREAPAVIGEVAAEVERRQSSPEGEVAPLYLFIFDLARFRDLRRDDDGFSFSRRDEGQSVSPADQLANILREGSAVGVYTIIWCDSLNNLFRSIDRTGMREFEMRVLFQMSAADSSNLIDSPLANKLGPYRAMFHSEDLGLPEKFRPYGFPPESWLEWVKQQLHGRTQDVLAGH